MHLGNKCCPKPHTLRGEGGKCNSKTHAIAEMAEQNILHVESAPVDPEEVHFPMFLNLWILGRHLMWNFLPLGPLAVVIYRKGHSQVPGYANPVLVMWQVCWLSHTEEEGISCFCFSKARIHYANAQCRRCSLLPPWPVCRSKCFNWLLWHFIWPLLWKLKLQSDTEAGEGWLPLSVEVVCTGTV